MRFLLFLVSIIFSGIFFIFSIKYGEDFLKKFQFFSHNPDFLFVSPGVIALVFGFLALFFFFAFTDFKKKREEKFVNNKYFFEYLKNSKKDILYLVSTSISSALVLYGATFLGFTLIQLTYGFFILHILFFYTTRFLVKKYKQKNIFIFSHIISIFFMYISGVYGFFVLLTSGQNFMISVVLTYLLGINTLYFYWYNNAISAFLSICLFGILTYVYLFDFFIGIILK